MVRGELGMKGTVFNSEYRRSNGSLIFSVKESDI